MLGKLFLSCCLIGLLSLVLSNSTLAAPPDMGGAEKCTECHEQEVDAWQDSPHARASAESGGLGATCEACHGRYVEDHPETEVMRLTVDSSMCKECHTNTFQEWTDSSHARAGVQCIGCHLSHSQAFRLTDDALCGSCHQDRAGNFDETCHGVADVACTDCHLSSTPGAHTFQKSAATASDRDVSEIAWLNGQPVGEANPAVMALLDFDAAVVTNPAAPKHDFTDVSSEDCLACHQEEIHQESLCKHGNTEAHQEMLVAAKGIPELTARLETVKQENRSLQIIAPVSLGLGIGIGGMLGIVLMLVMGYISQGRES
jgi:hypothetical protein